MGRQHSDGGRQLLGGLVEFAGQGVELPCDEVQVDGGVAALPGFQCVGELPGGTDE
ncbi:hypothetical protein [Streptomyces sp. NPDC058155]|uniref:hypothetical protein n=1 Tax=Streptomyces sp. NPDC058155 TaxID=3346359 RepID=UPI0036ED3363